MLFAVPHRSQRQRATVRRSVQARHGAYVHVSDATEVSLVSQLENLSLSTWKCSVARTATTGVSLSDYSAQLAGDTPACPLEMSRKRRSQI